MTSGWWTLGGSGTSQLAPRGRRGASRVVSALVLAGALGALGGFASAASAATTVSCGSTIDAAGSYALAADCSGLGITITASNVTLNLDGHTMTGTGAGTGGGSGVFVTDRGGPISDVTIQGPGKVSGYDAGVQFASSKLVSATPASAA